MTDGREAGEELIGGELIGDPAIDGSVFEVEPSGEATNVSGVDAGEARSPCAASDSASAARWSCTSS